MKDSRSSTQSVFDKWAALQNQTGFTLLEAMAVLALIGITSAIAAPSWLNFLEGSRLTTSRDQLYSAIRQTQVNAQRRGVPWQFSLRERNDFVEWAMHPRSVEPNAAQWESLDPSSVRIDEEETDFAQSGNVYYVYFDEDGHVKPWETEASSDDDTGLDEEKTFPLTLSSRQAPTLKRCLIVSTILGAMRKSKEQPVPNTDGDTCY